MIADAFLDTSVLVDFLVPSHEGHHRRAVGLMAQVESGLLRLHLSVTVIFETAYVLERVHQIPRLAVAESLAGLLALEGFVLSGKRELATTFTLWVRESPLSFADCYHLVLAKSLGLDAIYSFDRKMGRYAGVQQLEP